LNFYSQADRGRGIGTGLSDLDSGVRLGYQISRKFAPYIGFTYSSSLAQQQLSLAARASLFMFPAWCSEFGSGGKFKSPSKRWSDATWVNGLCLLESTIRQSYSKSDLS
jgi:hypothetical protein